MNKKLLAMLLAVAMIASLAVVPAAAAEKFPDAVGNWAESSIDRWADEGIVEGDTNGNINPGQYLTRAELATILVRLLGLTEKADAATFSDVAEGDWFADAVLKCAAAKIMLGDGAGHAAPNDPITREQAITMVGRALGVKPQSGHSLERFDDAELVSAYAEEYMIPLTAMGILSGVGDGSRVAPQDTIDRASALALLDKAIAHYVTAPGEVKADNANAFVVVNVTDADASDVTVSGETAGVLVTTGNAADVKLKGLSAGTVKVDAPVDVNVDGASKLGSVDVNAAANIDSKGVIGDLQLNDADATSNVTTEGNKPGANVGPTYRPGRPSRKKNVEDAEVLFITNADEYKEFFGEDMPTDHNIQLPWLVVSYTRNVAGTVTFSITKDGETVQFGTVAEGAAEATLTDTISSEFEASNDNAYLSVHLYSQANTDHKGQTWLNQTEAGGSYEATVELDGDEAVSAAATYVDKTALTAAIADAEADIAAVATSTDGAEVEPTDKWATEADKAAYQEAIDAAKGVADKADATQTEVDAAVAALAEATTTFENAKQAGTKPVAPTPEVDKTALNAAITAAKADIAAVATSTDGAEVEPTDKWVTTEAKTAYQNAITTAEGVANKADATQTEVDAAVAALAEATTTFENAKRAGTKPVAPTTYAINKAAATNGSFTVEVDSTVVTEAAAAATVTVTPEAAEGYEVDAVSYNDGTDHTVTADAETGAYTFTMPAAEVTVTVTFKAAAKASEVTFSVMTEENYDADYGTWASRPADLTGLQTDVEFTPSLPTVPATPDTKTLNFTGTLKYVENFTDFSSVVEEQAGNYLAISFTVPADATADATLTVSSAGKADRVLKLTAGATYNMLQRIDNKQNARTYKFDFDGEGAAYTAMNYVLSFTGMTLEGKAVTDQVVPANLGTGNTNPPANGLAEGYTATAEMTAANTYTVTVTADSLTAHKRSEGADTEDDYWMGFGFLKNDNTAKVKVDDTEVPTALNRFQTVDGKTYRTIYTTLTAANAPETFTLTEEDASGNVLATYNVTMTAAALTSPDYTITSAAATNGSFTVADTAKLGATVEIVPAANDGYEVESVKVDETAIEAVDGKYTFTMPGKDVTVTVTFAETTVTPTTHNVTFTATGWELTDVTNDGAAVTTLTSPIAVEEGKDLKFKVNVTEANKQVASVAAGETTLTADRDGFYTITMATVDVALTVTLEDVKYTITSAATENGSFTVKVGDAVATEAAAAATVTVTPEAAEGYEVDTVTVTDAESGNVDVTKGTDSYTFEMPAKNVTVTVTFKALPKASTTEFATMSDAVFDTCTWEGKPTTKDALTFTADETTATTINVTGTLNYVEGFEGFNSTKPEEQEGYYVFFQMAVPTEGETAGVITLKNAESGTSDKVYNTGDAGVLDTDGSNKVFATIWHITDKTAAPQIEIDWDGAGEAYTATTYTLDFSGVTLVGKAVTDQVVPANLGTSDNDFADGPANSLAQGYTASAVKTGINTYDVTVTATELTAHKRSEGADTADDYWMGFGFLKNDNTAKVKVDDTEVPTALNRFQTVGGKTYRTIYTTLAEADTAVTFTLTEEDASGNVLATYNVSMKATTLKEATPAEVTPAP